MRKYQEGDPFYQRKICKLAIDRYKYCIHHILNENNPSYKFYKIDQGGTSNKNILLKLINSIHLDEESNKIKILNSVKNLNFDNNEKTPEKFLDYDVDDAKLKIKAKITIVNSDELDELEDTIEDLYKYAEYIDTDYLKNRYKKINSLNLDDNAKKIEYSLLLDTLEDESAKYIEWGHNIIDILSNDIRDKLDKMPTPTPPPIQSSIELLKNIFYKNNNLFKYMLESNIDTKLSKLRNKITIEPSGGNIFAISAAEMYQQLGKLNDIDDYKTKVKAYLKHLKEKVTKHECIGDNKNGDSIRQCIVKIQSLIDSDDIIDGLKKMTAHIANKISDLDTKIIIQEDFKADFDDKSAKLVAFGLTRIKMYEGELLDLSIPVQNTVLGNIVCSSKSKNERLIEELEVIIFCQPKDHKTDKRINRYIIQNIYFNLHNVNEYYIPWYDIKSKLDQTYSSIEKTKFDGDGDDGDSEILAVSQDGQYTETNFTIEDFSQTQDLYDYDDEKDTDIISPLLLGDTKSIEAKIEELFGELTNDTLSEENKKAIDDAKKKGVYVQIYDANNIKQASKLTDTMQNALAIKKEEISKKTEINVCILATIGAKENEKPFVTLNRNIKTIINDMNYILNEELSNEKNYDKLRGYFKNIDSVIGISNICATILKKMTSSELLNKWVNEIKTRYTKKEVSDTKNTRFVSLNFSDGPTVKWNKAKLVANWKKHWQHNLVFSSNHIVDKNITMEDGS